MNIVIASDHAGFQMKKDILSHLHRNHVTWKLDDLGPEDDTSVDYPVYAYKVAKAVSGQDARRGILICGTGLGMSMMANRFLGVRAAVCLTEEMAQKSREHNRSNVLCLSGRMVELEENIKIITKWLKTDFNDADRHSRRIQLLDILQSR